MNDDIESMESTSNLMVIKKLNKKTMHDTP